jgi:hypothetical protein
MSSSTEDGRYWLTYQLRHAEWDTSFGIPETMNCELNYMDMIIGLIDRTERANTMVIQGFSLYQGNNKTYVCYAKDRNMNPINISNAVCVLTVKREKSDVTPVFQKYTNVPGQGEIGAPEKGEFYFYIVPTDTTSLEAERQYSFDVKILMPTTNVYTVAEGTILIKKPVNI